MDISAFESTAFEKGAFLIADLVDLAATETPDTAAISTSVYWAADLVATEAPDAASFTAVRNVPIDALAGQVQLAAGTAVLAASRLFLAGGQTFEITTAAANLLHNRAIVAGAGLVEFQSLTSRLYRSAFSYTDSEVVFVADAVRGRSVNPENRTMIVSPRLSTQELEEYREIISLPRRRVS